MKILVFSDTHLTNVFDEKKYSFLKKIIEGSDRVIINGDFWDGFLTRFDAFINSPWKKLFPLLREKQAVYIYGNHDRAKYSDSRVRMFSVVQTQEYELAVKNKTYLLSHGHSSFVFCDGKITIPRPLLHFFTRISGYFEWFFTKIWGRSTKYFGPTLNRRLKRRTKHQNGHISIYGHTHYAEYDAKNKFINTGYIQYGLAQYLLIDEERAVAKEEKYS